MHHFDVVKEYFITGMKLCTAKVISYFVKKEKYPQWLISERGDDARDNGYAFFEYIKNEFPKLKVAYIIKSTSPDYHKVSAIGETIEYGSFKHYIAIVKADYLISSHIMGFTPNPGFFVTLDKRLKNFKMILSGKKVFLQHGIIKDYIPGLCYPQTKVDTFICGAKAEYEYVLANYNYPEGVVNYTGLARYDKLLNYSTHKQILLMPTWRKWVNADSIEDFKKSEYFLRYQSLISNKILNTALKQYGYTMIFYPHYEIQKFISAFSATENIKIGDFKGYDVQTLLKESEMLITDYSSVYFDMAYMNKPIIFYQFDQKQFFENHYQKGYFNEKLFGIVTDDENEVVNLIIKYLNNMLSMNGFIKGEKEFFEYKDDKNCERIMKAILGKGS